MTTITRFAPSPTGYIHVGNLRTALMNWLIARKAGGTFILRLDDTDQERSKQEYADGIQEDLAWLGLTWDRIEKQSLRFDRYREAADELRAAGRFYECFETPVELDLKRKKLLNMHKPPVYDRAALRLTAAERDALRAEGREGYWRFLLDQERIEWTDGILGPVSIDAGSISDPVLIRADGQILYTFASSVDDIDMGVTNIVRGADHVTNTATQIQIMRALGGTPPAFAHHSLLTGPQGEALSKRLGTLSLRDLRAQGVEPMALLSLMARLGSSKPVELAGSLEDLIEGFDLPSFGAAPTRFDAEDLFPLTRAHVQTLPLDAVAGRIRDLGVPDDLADAFWRVARGNITVLADLDGWWQLFRDGAVPLVDPEDAGFVAEALALLPPRPWTQGTWGEWTETVRAATGRKGKALYRPLRRALTGRDAGPEMAEVLPLLQNCRRSEPGNTGADACARPRHVMKIRWRGGAAAARRADPSPSPEAAGPPAPAPAPPSASGACSGRRRPRTHRARRHTGRAPRRAGESRPPRTGRTPPRSSSRGRSART
jgi:glutamyl-tRNA synthetase